MDYSDELNNNNIKNSISFSIQNANNDKNYPYDSKTNQNLSDNQLSIINEIEEEDIESNFSVISRFKRFKDYFNNKDNFDFLINIIQIKFTAIILFMIFRYSLRFNPYINKTMNILEKTISNPWKFFIYLLFGIFLAIFYFIFFIQ